MGRNVLKLDTRGFTEYAEKLDRLDADLKSIFTDALQQAAETVTEDTIDAVADGNLPAGGKYSSGETKESIIKNPKVEWSGTFGQIGVGFDFGKPGAGGYLITGTPRMRPVRELTEIYKTKRYMNNIRKGMVDIFEDEIKRRMGG